MLDTLRRLADAAERFYRLYLTERTLGDATARLRLRARIVLDSSRCGLGWHAWSDGVILYTSRKLEPGVVLLYEHCLRWPCIRVRVVEHRR